MEAQPELEYRLYGNSWRVVARVGQDGHAEIEATETVAGREVGPVTADADLDREAREELDALLPRLSLAAWDEAKVEADVQAVVVTPAGGRAWTGAAIETDGPPRDLRRWAEANLRLVLHGSNLARQRAEAAEEVGQHDVAIGALKEAIDRLGTWYLPDQPSLDETGVRYADGEASRKRGELIRAMDRFRQVLEMRTENYVKKYGP